MKDKKDAAGEVRVHRGLPETRQKVRGSWFIVMVRRSEGHGIKVERPRSEVRGLSRCCVVCYRVFTFAFIKVFG